MAGGPPFKKLLTFRVGFSFELRVTMTNTGPTVSGPRKRRVAQALMPVRSCRPRVRHQSNYDCKTRTGSPSPGLGIKSACATKILQVSFDKNESAVKRFVQERNQKLPAKKRAASTKATPQELSARRRSGFVEAAPRRVFRGGAGRFGFRRPHNPKFPASSNLICNRTYCPSSRRSTNDLNY